jgi:hypothetical protein
MRRKKLDALESRKGRKEKMEGSDRTERKRERITVEE